MDRLKDPVMSNKCSISPGEDDLSSEDDGEYLEVDEQDPHQVLDGANGDAKAAGSSATDEFESFLVHLTGSVTMTEPSIQGEPGSLVIEKSIVQVTEGNNSPVNKSFIMRITAKTLDLIDLSGSNGQDKSSDISKIRLEAVKLWGIRGHQFAFIVRSLDSPRCITQRDIQVTSQKDYLMLDCHVFKCEDDGLESASQRISNLLREQRLKMVFRPDMKASISFLNTTLDHEYVDGEEESDISTPDVEFFPTPVEEPFKILSARYLASVPVAVPSGIDVLNDAIDRVIFEISRIKDRMTHNILKAGTGKGRARGGAIPKNGTKYTSTMLSSGQELSADIDEEDDEEEGFLLARKYYDVNCNIKISPSSIVVETASGDLILEGRVRYLSFMGISRSSIQVSGFILQVAEGTFEAHVFECSPDAGILCKTLEAACKLRYQKCLDAHKRRQAEATGVSVSGNGKSGLDTVKTMFSKMFLKG